MPKLRAPRDPQTKKLKIARAIHANEGVQAWYTEQLNSLLDAMGTSMAVHMLAAYCAAHIEVGFAQDASGPTLLSRALKKWGGLWVKRFDKLSFDLARKFGDKNFHVTQTQMAAAFKDAGFTVKFKPTRASVQAYQSVVAEQVGLIKSIPQKYLADVQSNVYAAVMRGGDADELATSLKKTLGISHRRAANIARDQNRKAKAVIENTRRQELGIEEAIWMHSHGGVTPRPTHVAMNGKRYKLAKGMYDSDEGKFVWPGELINCRCTSRPIIPGLEDEED